MKKTLIIMSLILLLAPVTILTTIFLSTTSNYLRVQADPCTNGVGGEFIANPPSTIPEGTPSITVSGTDPCDPSHTRLEFRIWDGGCGSIGYGATIVTQAYALTDDSSAFAVNIQTSTLSASQGSYCLTVQDIYGSVRGRYELTATPGWTNVYSTPVATYMPPSGPSSRVHVATPGAPFVVGQQIYISYYTDVGVNGNAAATIVNACTGVPSCPGAGWVSSPTHISGGLAYDVTAPGLLTPGTYYAVVEFVPDVGGGYEYGWAQFDVVAGGGYTSTTFIDTYQPPSGGGAGFGFSLGLSPSSLSVAPGSVANFQIQITYSDPSFSGTTIHVEGVSGLGAGMNYQIIPSPPALRISTSPSTQTGTYTVTLTGSANGVTRQATATVLVQGAQQTAFDFSIVPSPLDQIMNPGGSVTYTITVGLASGSAQSVTLSVPDAPSGVTVTFSQSSGSPPFTSILTVSASQSSSPGKYPLTVTGTGGGTTHRATVGLVIEPAAGSQVVNPPSQTVSQVQSTSETQSSQSTQMGGPSTPTDLLGMIQQNSLLVIGLLAVVVVLFGVLALRGRKPSPPPSPSYPAQIQPLQVACGACGTINPPGNEFCANCGTKLQ